MDTTTTNPITLSDWLLIIQAVILFLGLGFTALSVWNNKNHLKLFEPISKTLVAVIPPPL